MDSRSVHAFVIGEHGDSELPVWSSANISGIDLKHFCEIQGEINHTEDMDRLFVDVRDSAYEIIRKKGATYYGIAMEVRRISESIVRNEHSNLPKSSLISGHYGLEKICMSVPTIIGSAGVEKVLDIPLDETEQQLLMRSAEALQEVLRQIQWYTEYQKRSAFYKKQIFLPCGSFPRNLEAVPRFRYNVKRNR